MGLVFIFILAMIALTIFVFLPLPLYVSGKILKITNPAFTYISCIWTSFVAGLLGGIVSMIVNGILGTTFSMGTPAQMSILPILISLAISYAFWRYMLMKKYAFTEKQVLMAFLIMIAFGMAISFLIGVLVVTLGMTMPFAFAP